MRVPMLDCTLDSSLPQSIFAECLFSEERESRCNELKSEINVTYFQSYKNTVQKIKIRRLPPDTRKSIILYWAYGRYPISSLPHVAPFRARRRDVPGMGDNNSCQHKQLHCTAVGTSVVSILGQLNTVLGGYDRWYHCRNQ